MTRNSYPEQDYAFGQVMLTLRTTLMLTQAGLANVLGVSRNSVTDWEAGNKYPNTEHLKTLITYAVQNQAFAAGHEAEHIRTLWKAAHQKTLLDEHWLAALLGTTPASQTKQKCPWLSSSGIQQDHEHIQVNKNVTAPNAPFLSVGLGLHVTDLPRAVAFYQTYCFVCPRSAGG